MALSASPQEAPSLPYTIAGDPQIEAAVRSLFAQITAVVASELRPAALVLHGSFGRGEGGAYMMGDQLRLANDVDLMAVYHSPISIVRFLRARKRVKRVVEGLVGASVSDLDLVTRPAAVLSSPPPSLKYFEMVLSARVLYGAVRIAPPSQVPFDHVPPGDVVARLRNRGVGLLAAQAYLASGAADLSDAAARTVQTAINAAFLACGDVWLYRTGNYDHRLAVKAERFRRLRTAVPGPSGRLCDEYERAVQERFFPTPRIPLSCTHYLGRWQRAVEEWLVAFYTCERDGWSTRGMFSVSEWHPVRLLLRMAKAGHRYAKGLLSVRAQNRALPLLLECALDHRDSEPRYASIAAVIKSLRNEAHDQASLIRRFLSLA